MSIELKIKSKHLAEESRIIKREKEALKRKRPHDYVSQINSIISHKSLVIKPEARATHLARAYLSNTPYLSVEKSRKVEKDYEFTNKVLPRTYKLAKKYSNESVSLEDIQNWIST